MLFINGIKIFVSPDTPKMVLSVDVPVPTAFREDYNRWLAEFFGYTNLVADGQALHSQIFNILHVNPRTYALLKQEGVKHEH